MGIIGLDKYVHAPAYSNQSHSRGELLMDPVIIVAGLIILAVEIYIRLL